MNTCETCTYMYDDTPGTHRECRRYPPVLLNKLGTAMFPVIRKTDWCGEYKHADADMRLEQGKTDAKTESAWAASAEADSVSATRILKTSTVPIPPKPKKVKK